MGVIELASYASVECGYDYYKTKKVLSVKQTDDGIFDAVVQGSDNNKYNVHLDVTHSRKTTCNCPHADGKRIICKHAMAVFFSVCPEEAENYYEETVRAEERYEKEQDEQEDLLIDYINSLKKSELIDAFWEVWSDLPDWAMDRFINSHDILPEKHRISLKKLVDCLILFSPQKEVYIDLSNDSSLVILRGHVFHSENIAVSAIHRNKKRFLKVEIPTDEQTRNFMRKFVAMLKEGDVKSNLSKLLKSAVSPDDFENEVFHFGMIDAWTDFYKKELTRLAKNWCDEHDLWYY